VHAHARSPWLQHRECGRRTTGPTGARCVWRQDYDTKTISYFSPTMLLTARVVQRAWGRRRPCPDGKRRTDEQALLHRVGQRRRHARRGTDAMAARPQGAAPAAHLIRGDAACAGARLPGRRATAGACRERRELPPIEPRGAGSYWWHEFSLPAALLHPGGNAFEFRTDAEAMDAWSLALEDGHRYPPAASARTVARPGTTAAWATPTSCAASTSCACAWMW
jgi:hypothetical protein